MHSDVLAFLKAINSPFISSNNCVPLFRSLKAFGFMVLVNYNVSNLRYCFSFYGIISVRVRVSLSVKCWITFKGQSVN